MNKKEDLFPTPGLHNAIERFRLLLTASVKSKTYDHILVRGPRGTGKSYFLKIALDILKCSSPPVHLNCASISPGLADSELFGHVKGAFTDAVQTTSGFIEEAKKTGLIILEEFNSLPSSIQAKLLLFMDNFFYYGVGGRERKNAAVRIIATANEEEGTSLRNDTEDRFKISVEVPPLYLRRNDILYFIGKKYPHLELSASMLLLLYNYHWPGNTRELDRALFELSAGIRHQYKPTWFDLNIFFTSLSPKFDQIRKEHPEIFEQVDVEPNVDVNDFPEISRHKIRLVKGEPAPPIENILSKNGSVRVPYPADLYPVPVLDLLGKSKRKIGTMPSVIIQQFFQCAYGHNAILNQKSIHEYCELASTGQEESPISVGGIADYLIQNNRDFPSIMRLIIDKIGRGGQTRLAEILGVSTKTVNTWVKKGTISKK